MTPELYRKMAESQDEHWWFSARREILSRVIGTLKLGDTPTILEVGCGTGGNLKMLTTFGKVTAVEHDPFSRQFASQVSGIQVRDGTLPDDLCLDEQFDLVCLFDVLEHVKDDSAALAALRKLLKPNGFILITAPAYSWLFGKHDLNHQHYRRYTLTDISIKANTAGLSIVRGGYFNSILFPLALLRRFCEYAFPGKLAPETDMPNRYANSALRTLFELERIFVSRFFLFFGLSVIAILRHK